MVRGPQGFRWDKFSDFGPPGQGEPRKEYSKLFSKGGWGGTDFKFFCPITSKKKDGDFKVFLGWGGGKYFFYGVQRQFLQKKITFLKAKEALGGYRF